MRIRWRGLELPSAVIEDDSVSTDWFARFFVEPFERGFGTTIGNSLRRVLLSSLMGAAVTRVRIHGAAHEFTSLKGVLEDVTDIILNVKGIVVHCEADTPKTMKVVSDTAGEVKAGDIEADPAIKVYNPDHVLATLTDDVHFEMEMQVCAGRGYRTAQENAAGEQEIGVIPIDSAFSPVTRVRYRTEDTRVGQRVNFDKLILEIWTNGTVAPDDALVEASKILRKHLNPFVQYHEMGSLLVQSAAPQRSANQEVNSELETLLQKPVSELELSVRASNCLEAARIMTIGDLATKSEADLLRLRSFGKTSLREIRRKLAEFGLSLGTVLDRSSTQPGETSTHQPTNPTIEPQSQGPETPTPGIDTAQNPSQVSVPADQN